MDQMTVKVGAFPGGKIQSVTLPVGATVADALKAGKIMADGDNIDVRVNGQKISSNGAVVNDGEQVLVFSQVRGN